MQEGGRGRAAPIGIDDVPCVQQMPAAGVVPRMPAAVPLGMAEPRPPAAAAAAVPGLEAGAAGALGCGDGLRVPAQAPLAGNNALNTL